MWKTLIKSISLSEQIFEQSGGVSGQPATAAPSAREASEGCGVVAGLDIPAEAAFLRHVLDVAHGQPDLAGRDAGAEGLFRGASPDPCQDQRTAQDARVARSKLVVH